MRLNSAPNVLFERNALMWVFIGFGIFYLLVYAFIHIAGRPADGRVKEDLKHSKEYDGG